MFTINNPIPPQESFEIERAISYLVNNYNKSGHNPKPVIVHSLRVAIALLEMGYSKEIIVAAILHDILEDTSITPEELKQEFGNEILALIQAVTYDNSITDPVDQYKDMYNRVLQHGRSAVVLKAMDIAINSLYIRLVPDKNKQKELVEKGTYFLTITESKYSGEPAWKILKERNLEEIENVL